MNQTLEHRITLLEFKIQRFNAVIALMVSWCPPDKQREAAKLLELIDRQAGVTYAAR